MLFAAWRITVLHSMTSLRVSDTTNRVPSEYLSRPANIHTIHILSFTSSRGVCGKIRRCRIRIGVSTEYTESEFLPADHAEKKRHLITVAVARESTANLVHDM